MLWYRVRSHSCAALTTIHLQSRSPPHTEITCVFLVPFHGSTMPSLTIPFSTLGYCALPIPCSWIVAILVISKSLYFSRIHRCLHLAKSFFFSSSWNPVLSSSLFPPPALTLFKYFCLLLIIIDVIFQRFPRWSSVLLGSEWLLCLGFCSALPPLVPFLFLQLSGPFRAAWEVRKWNHILST